MSYDDWKTRAPEDDGVEEPQPVCMDCAARPPTVNSDLCAACLDCWYTGGH